MTAFSVAAALGIPFGLQLAQHLRWEAPFFLLAGIAGVMWVIAFLRLPAIRGHLQGGRGHAPRAFAELLRDANAGRALLFMAAMVLGHFTIIPLLSPYLVSNVGLPERDLFLVYFTGGVLTVFTAPLIGKLADSLGRLRVFSGLVAVASVVTLVITHSGRLPVWAVLGSGRLVFCIRQRTVCSGAGDHDAGRAGVTPGSVHELERLRARPRDGNCVQHRRLDRGQATIGTVGKLPLARLAGSGCWSCQHLVGEPRASQRIGRADNNSR